VNVINNDIQVTAFFSNLAAAYCLGATAVNARLVAPSLRKYANHTIFPIDYAATPSTATPFEYMGFYNPLPITTGDLLEADVDTHGSTEYDTIAAWLSQGKIAPCTGQVFTARATMTSTLTAHKWSIASPLVFETTLEEGIYAIVGMAYESATGILARLVFPGVANAVRPGCIAQTTVAKQLPLCFRYGRLGVWGLFDAAVLPQIEVLATSADTSEEVILDLIKLTIGSQAFAAASPGMAITQAMGVSPAPTSVAAYQ
jgi:hypothetical protein